MKELTEAEKQVTIETHELHVSLDDKQRKLTEYQTHIANIEKYASDLFIFCFRLSCIFSTDMGGDSSATTLWACLSLLRKKTISTGSFTYDTVYIKDTNSVAVSSGWGGRGCITIIDIESQKVMTTISMNTDIGGMAVRGRTIYYVLDHVNHNMSLYLCKRLRSKVCL
jgi:hypothetical protein